MQRDSAGKGGSDLAAATPSSQAAAKPSASGTGLSVWWLAFGYFACYVPYSALTKALTSGLAYHDAPRLSGVSLLPMSVLASTVSMLGVITWLGWWKHAGTRRVFGATVPMPGPWTFLSGLATAAIVVTTTLAYTFEGVSIPWVMLLMRGGVLVLAPIVDALSGRKVRRASRIALGLSLLALLDAVAARGGTRMPILCLVDIALYLFGYFVRLRFMSRLAKSQDGSEGRRYFVEEQMVATPAAILALALLAAVPADGPFADLRRGFLDVPHHPALLTIVLIGVLSQGTGLFGGLVLLDARENSFCVPLNRASSILAGILAQALIATILGGHGPSGLEAAGAALLVGAIAVLSRAR